METANQLNTEEKDLYSRQMASFNDSEETMTKIKRLKIFLFGLKGVNKLFNFLLDNFLAWSRDS